MKRKSFYSSLLLCADKMIRDDYYFCAPKELCTHKVPNEGRNGKKYWKLNELSSYFLKIFVAIARCLKITEKVNLKLRVERATFTFEGTKLNPNAKIMPKLFI